jgi:hypothetical protein
LLPFCKVLTYAKEKGGIMPILILLFLLTSCSSFKVNKEYLQSKEYEQREALQTSFVKDKGEDLTEAEITSLLSKKIELKDKIKMVVTYIGPRSFFQVTKDRETIFSEIIKNDSRLQDIQFIPTILLPKDKSFKKLREIAALMQADLLLFIESKEISNFKFYLLTKNETKATVSIEAIVMDVKSGAIPFSSRATESKLIENGVEDFTREEFITKASLQAEDLALKEIMNNVHHYFN